MTVNEATVIAENLLQEGRAWLRRSTSRFDEEILQTIAACMLDLQNAGVVKISCEDPLIKQAAKLYLKGQSGFDDSAEKWNAAYEHLRDALSLSGDYTEKKEDG